MATDTKLQQAKIDALMAEIKRLRLREKRADAIIAAVRDAHSIAHYEGSSLNFRDDDAADELQTKARTYFAVKQHDSDAVARASAEA